MTQLEQNTISKVARLSEPSASFSKSNLPCSALASAHSGVVYDLQQQNNVPESLPITAVGEVLSDFQSNIDQAYDQFCEALGLSQ